MKTAEDVLRWKNETDWNYAPDAEDRATAERIARALRVLEVVEAEAASEYGWTNELIGKRVRAALDNDGSEG